MKNISYLTLFKSRASNGIENVLFLLFFICASTQANTINTVENPANDVGESSSIAVGIDGFPIISYFDRTAGTLKVAKCNDTACSGELATISTVDNSGNVGEYSSIAVGTDGFPVISYYDAAAGALKVAKCNDQACADADENIVTVDNSGDVGQATSIAVDVNNHPVISYLDVSAGALKVVKCDDAHCVGGNENITVLDNSGDVLGPTSLAMDAFDVPVIVYREIVSLVTNQVKVAKCANTMCSGTVAVPSVVETGGSYQDPDVSIDDDGRPVISYYEHRIEIVDDIGFVRGVLIVAWCNDFACTGGDETITTVDDPANDVGYFSNIDLDDEGYPVIGYFDKTAKTLKVAKCNDVKCTGGDEEITTVIGTNMMESTGIGLVIGNDDFPVISLHDGIDQSLKMVHCGSINCLVSLTENISSMADGPAEDVGSYSSIAVPPDGLPVISYFADDLYALKVVKCNDPDCTGGDESISTLEYGVGEHTSIAIGLDGLPVISYHDVNNSSLKVAKCDDAECVGGDEIISTVDNAGVVGDYSSIAIDSNGLPVISYFDWGGRNLKLAKCDDAACSGTGESITIVDSDGNVGEYTSIAIGGDGLPVISYYDDTNRDLKVAKCYEADCTGSIQSPSVVTVDAPGSVGEYTSIARGGDGYPVISYFSDTADSVMIAKCDDLACSGPGETISPVDDLVANVGWFTSIAVDAGGLPVISYYDVSNLNLKVAKCHDADCSGSENPAPSITTVDFSGAVGSHNSIAFGSDGWPVISYYDDTNNSLKVAKCHEEDCSGTVQQATITTVDESHNHVGRFTSIAIGLDGLPVISYQDWDSHALMVAKCNDIACSGEDETASILYDSISADADWTSIALGADGFPIISFYHETSGYDRLAVVKCNDASCAGDDEILNFIDYPPGQTPFGDFGNYNSIAVGSDGFPVISYYDWTHNHLRIAKCGTAACYPGIVTITTLDTSFGFTGGFTSIALDSSDLPVISYFSAGNLKVAKCSQADCRGTGDPTSVTTVDDSEGVGWYSSIAIGMDDFPIISYRDETNKSLKVAKCDDPACTGDVTITTLDDSEDVGQFTSIAIDVNGLPIISYQDWAARSQKIARCGDAACVGGNESITTLDGPRGGVFEGVSSIAIGLDGLPVISSLGERNGSLGVVHCGSIDCIITNTADASLIIVKRIINDNGGTATVGAFGINTGAGTPSFGGGVADGANTLKYTSSALSVNANTPYSLTENNIAGYTEGSWSCVGGDNFGGGAYNSGTVTLAPGITKTCTITNNDDAASLIIVKRIINDNGGTATVGAFGINTGAGTPSFGGGVADGANTLKYTSSALSVNANTPYSLTENNIAGYTEGSWACVGGDNLGGGDYNNGSVTLGPGVTKTCTITNNDSAASLIIVKRIINDNGGTATVGAFGINTGAGTPSFGGGVADGANTLKYTSSALSVNANTPFSLTENNIAGYTEGSWSCVGGDNLGGGDYNNGSVTLGPGVTKTCTITNNDSAASLIVVKRIINDNGGTATVGAFGINTGAGTPSFGGGVADGANTLKYTSSALSVNANTPYSLTENNIAGYTEGSWSCVGGDNFGGGDYNNGSVTLGPGVTKTCTITNNDSAASLIVVKRIINDNGGTATVGAFGINTGAGTPSFGGGVADGANTLKYTSSALSVNANTPYSLTENNIAGYTEGSWSCVGGDNFGGGAYNSGTVTLAPGITKTCTITNNDDAASLIIVKRIINDNGGTATVGAFGINTGAGTPSFGGGVADGANTLKYTSSALSVNANTPYSLTENNIAGYTEGSWACVGGDNLGGGDYNNGSVTLGPGVTKTCTITNNDSAASLIIVKRIINDNGGTATVGAFGINTGAGTPSFGGGVADGANTLKYTSSALSVNANTPYSLTENNIAGYTEGSWSCVGGDNLGGGDYNNGSVTLGPGVTKTCTITNNDSAASLIVVKRIINDNGGTATVGAFGINTGAGTPSFGGGVADGANTLKYTSSALSVNANTPYSLTENNIAGYTEGSWSCVGGDNFGGGAYNSGTVTLAPGITKTCTITNNDDAASLIIVKRIVNDNGGTATVGAFGINTGAGTPSFGGGVADGANTLKYTSSALSVNANTPYSLTEDLVTGYTAGTWTCVGGDNLGGGDYNNGSVTLGPGVTKTCTITNNDSAASLIIVKRIINDNGGTATVGAFGINTGAGTPSFGGGVADGANTLKYTSSALSVNANTPFSLTENNIAGYTEGSWSCVGGDNLGGGDYNNGSVTLGPGVTKTCTITNNDSAASLIVVKRIINDNGGTATVGAFGINTGAGTPSFGGGVADGANTLKYTSSALSVNANTPYSLTENNIAGYTEGSWSCVGGDNFGGGAYNSGTVTLAPGITKTCTITNNDDAASLIIVKRIVNDNGGTATVGAFGINTGAGTPSFGGGVADGANTLKYTSSALSVNANTPYSLTEDLVTGYTAGTWTCVGGDNLGGGVYNSGTVTLAVGVTKTCTITNNDNPPAQLTLRKVVDNSGGGTLKANEWTLSATGSGGFNGKPTGTTLDESLAPAAVTPGVTYTLNESGPSGYSPSAWSCNGGSQSGAQISLSSGDNVTCTITNTFAATAPNAPILLSVVPVSHLPLKMDLTWQDNSDNEKRFVTERGLCGDNDTCFDEVLITQTPDPTTMGLTKERSDGCLAEPKLAQNVRYYFRVKAMNDAGSSDWSSVVSAVTGIGSDNCGSSTTTNGSIATQIYPPPPPSATVEGTTGAPLSFAHPRATALDRQGRVIVADTDNHRIQICAAGSCTSFGGVGTGVGQFNRPQGVAVDHQDRIWVADTDNDRLQRCTDVGVCTVMGSAGSAPGQFLSPHGIAVDGHGRILVADTDNDRIQRCQAFGSCAVIDSSLGPFNAPQGVTAAADGHIWVADTGNDRIQGCTAQGACTSFGTRGSELGQFDTPTRMSMDSDDRMVIADTGNARVVMCSTEGICQDLGREYMEPSGVDIDDRGQVAVADASLEVVELLCLVTVEDVFGGEGTTDGSFSSPQGVASDSTRRTIVADTANHRIRVCSGNNCSSFGGLGTNPGAFHAPAGVAVDATDRIIVADTLNDRIQICTDTGTCTAFGTTGTAVGQFDTPTGVAIDSTGRILVADSLNNRIQVCTDTGTCSAFGTLGSATGQFDLPWGVAVDGSDQIIVTDNNNNRIQVCTETGTCTAFGTSGSKLGEFQLPRGVAVDSKDQILISDWGNDRIQVCGASGNCSAFGKTGTDTGEFTRPSGVAADTHDRILVADTDNHRLQTLQRCAPTERVFSAGFEE